MQIMPTNLAPELVERGKILKYPIVTTPVFSVSILELFPNSKIKRHKHMHDKEYYFLLNEKILMVCSKGNEHELENPSKEESILVLSIKMVI